MENESEDQGITKRLQNIIELYYKLRAQRNIFQN